MLDLVQGKLIAYVPQIKLLFDSDILETKGSSEVQYSFTARYPANWSDVIHCKSYM